MHTFPRSLLKHSVTNCFESPFQHKVHWKITKNILQWETSASISHYPKYCSSARPWEGVYCTCLAFHFHLFHEGKKENKHEEGTNSHPRGKKSPATTTPTLTRWIATSQNLSLLMSALPRGGRLPPTHTCRKSGFAQAQEPLSLSANVIRNPGQPRAAACLESTWDRPAHSFFTVRRNSLVHCG